MIYKNTTCKVFTMSKYGVKLFKGNYKELTIFFGQLQLRFSIPQTAAWWGYRQIYSFGRGHHEKNKSRE